MSTFDPSEDQELALKAIAEWYRADPLGKGSPVFRLLGAAGTGKTTTARLIPEALNIPYAHYAAFTGKASSVLARKGCVPVSTLHSLLMSPLDGSKLLDDITATREVLATMNGHDPAATAAVRERLAVMEARAALGPQFAAKVAEGDLDDLGVLVVDESSMVDEALLSTLLEVRIPIIALGDPYQLPPVKGTGGLLHKRWPGFELSQIHRQAQGSDVLDLATRIRQSDDRWLGLTGTDFTPVSSTAGVLPRCQSQDDPSSVIITYTNAGRLNRTAATRAAWGFPPDRAVVGDVLMAVMNNDSATGGPILNGQLFEVLDVGAVEPATAGRNHGAGKRVEMTLRDEVGNVARRLAYTRPLSGPVGDLWFTKSGSEGQMRGYGHDGEAGVFVFGQACTAHKAQGSEFDQVMVWDDWQAMNRSTKGGILQVRRWLYTAVTRAKHKVILRQEP